MNRLNLVDRSRENPQSDVKQKSNHHNNPNQNSNTSKKVIVIGDSTVKYLRLYELYSSGKRISIMKHSVIGGYGGLCETCSKEETRHTNNSRRDE